MDRLEAIRELAKHDHGILSPEAAQELATPFGTTVKPQTFEVGQGRAILEARAAIAKAKQV